ncbi:sulfur carrier protein ThiS [Fusobacterium necrophorum]|uniref:sulfur carrier protein ThiS n=1 Tax=Fusobacterium necrophorum TaxID=859 RepID=UPI000788BAA1|nr:sulfur carrier protein ThiS [Fusobacterium necrophorum]KYM44859.1 thiamine biosynthesis protein ThiS [Fusobacterium necrophorum subsp. funduliforme]
MKVTINGLDREIPENMNILTLLENLSIENNISLAGAIVLVNEVLIPRDSWKESIPEDSANIEIVSFVSGG